MVLKGYVCCSALLGTLLIIVLVHVLLIAQVILTTLLIGKVALVSHCAHKHLQLNYTQIILLELVCRIALLSKTEHLEIQF
jgi:hypothetical protein